MTEQGQTEGDGLLNKAQDKSLNATICVLISRHMTSV